MSKNKGKEFMNQEERDIFMNTMGMIKDLENPNLYHSEGDYKNCLLYNKEKNDFDHVIQEKK